MNENTKKEILEMFSKGGRKRMREEDEEPNIDGAAKLAVREAAELLAPIFWVSSVSKLFDLGRQVFMFALGVFGFYLVFNWFLTGVPASWWLVFQVPLAFFGVMMAMLGIFR